MADIEQSQQIAGVVVVTPRVHGDDRGRFVETYRRSWFPLGREMIQQNRSEKTAGTLVGLHYHLHQADYWYAMRGRLQVVLYDLRTDSPTENNSLTLELDGATECGVFIPPGVAHGFATITDALLCYSVDSYYNPADELGLAWDDPALNIEWAVTDPVVSERDTSNPKLAEISDPKRPHWGLRT